MENPTIENNQSEKTPEIARSGLGDRPRPALSDRKWAKWVFWAVTILLLGALLVFVMQKIQESFLEEVTIEAPLEERIAETTTSSRMLINVPAPNFTLKGSADTELYASRGKPVVILFFASWNDASMEQLRALEGSWRKLEQEKITTFAIDNLETVQSLDLLRERGGYTISMLADEEGIVGEAYAINTLPTFFFIDGEGMIRDRHVGPMTEEEILIKALQIK